MEWGDNFLYLRYIENKIFLEFIRVYWKILNYSLQVVFSKTKRMLLKRYIYYYFNSFKQNEMFFKHFMIMHTKVTCEYDENPPIILNKVFIVIDKYSRTFFLGLWFCFGISQAFTSSYKCIYIINGSYYEKCGPSVVSL